MKNSTVSEGQPVSLFDNDSRVGSLLKVNSLIARLQLKWRSKQAAKQLNAEKAEKARLEQGRIDQAVEIAIKEQQKKTEHAVEVVNRIIQNKIDKIVSEFNKNKEILEQSLETQRNKAKYFSERYNKLEAINRDILERNLILEEEAEKFAQKSEKMSQIIQDNIKLNAQFNNLLEQNSKLKNELSSIKRYLETKASDFNKDLEVIMPKLTSLLEQDQVFQGQEAGRIKEQRQNIKLKENNKIPAKNKASIEVSEIKLDNSRYVKLAAEKISELFLILSSSLKALVTPKNEEKDDYLSAIEQASKANEYKVLVNYEAVMFETFVKSGFINCDMNPMNM
jgi:hypothetical protein